MLLKALGVAEALAEGGELLREGGMAGERARGAPLEADAGKGAGRPCDRPDPQISAEICEGPSVCWTNGSLQKGDEAAGGSGAVSPPEGIKKSTPRRQESPSEAYRTVTASL